MFMDAFYRSRYSSQEDDNFSIIKRVAKVTPENVRKFDAELSSRQ